MLCDKTSHRMKDHYVILLDMCYMNKKVLNLKELGSIDWS